MYVYAVNEEYVSLILNLVYQRYYSGQHSHETESRFIFSLAFGKYDLKHGLILLQSLISNLVPCSSSRPPSPTRFEEFRVSWKCL